MFEPAMTMGDDSGRKHQNILRKVARVDIQHRDVFGNEDSYNECRTRHRYDESADDLAGRERALEFHCEASSRAEARVQ